MLFETNRELVSYMGKVLAQVTKTPEYAVWRTRRRPNPYGRAIIANYLVRRLGMSTTKAGQLIHKDHATVMHLLDMYDDAERNPTFKAERQLKTKFGRELLNAGVYIYRL